MRLASAFGVGCCKARLDRLTIPTAFVFNLFSFGECRPTRCWAISSGDEPVDQGANRWGTGRAQKL